MKLICGFVFRTLLSPIIGEKDYVLHEESWNAYPYSKTVVTNPTYMKGSFRVILETMHLPDRGSRQNPFDSSCPSELIDIADPRSKKLPEDLGDPSSHVARVQGGQRGPLGGRNWVSTVRPVMTCYKQVTVVCKWGFLTNRLEKEIQKSYRELLLAFHQKIWLSIAQWIHMNLEQVKELEQ